MMNRRIFSKGIIAVFLFAFLLAVSTSHAALIGIKGLLGYPDISFDILGTLTYKAQTGELTIEGYDWKLTMTKSGPEYILTDTDEGFETSFYINMTVTSDGKLISGSMKEVVSEGNVTIGDKTYPKGTTLLAGSVYAFGFLAGSSGAQHQFDFLVSNLCGALVDDGIWPKNFPTGIYAHGQGIWDGTFNKDFRLWGVSGDKAPVPVPTTLILLGSGLSAIGLIRFRKNKRG